VQVGNELPAGLEEWLPVRAGSLHSQRIAGTSDAPGRLKHALQSRL